MSKSRDFKRIQRLRRILQGRKKTGRKTFSYTIALTPEQIQWLTERYTNASEVIRRLLDDHMRTMDKVEPDIVKLGYKLKRLVTEKEAKEEEKHTHWSDNEKIERDFIKMKRKQKFYAKFLETPEEEIKIDFPEDENEEHPQIWIYLPDLPNTENYMTLPYSSYRYEKMTPEEKRRNVLDRVRDLEPTKYEREVLATLRREKAIFDAIQSAFAENIRLLEEEIDKLREEISLLNKQTNQQS